MKRLIGLTALLASLGCAKDNKVPDVPAPIIQEMYIDTSPSPLAQDYSSPTAIDPTFKIASWNIQVFGKSKREKPEVLEKIINVMNMYPLIAVQEFRDAAEETIPFVLEKLNVKGNYSVVSSPRLGRTNSKEQYAFFYDNSVEFLGKDYVFDDKDDVFEREPHVGYFRVGKFDFVLINIHTRPDDAKSEIDSLDKVVLDAQARFPDEGDFIILGDLNADGSYYPESDMSRPLRQSKYTWVIPDDADTTVADSDNTYDRMIFTEATLEDYANYYCVFRFDKVFSLTQDEAKKISDHYLIFAKFYSNRDSD